MKKTFRATLIDPATGAPTTQLHCGTDPEDLLYIETADCEHILVGIDHESGNLPRTISNLKGRI